MRRLMIVMMGFLAAVTVHAADYKVLADRKVNFDAYKTFRFEKVTITRINGKKVKPANFEHLRDAIAERLVKEGLTKDDHKPDLLVTVIAGTEAALSPAETQGVPYFDGAWRILPKTGEPAVEDDHLGESKYGQASLRIDLKDSKTGNVVWRVLVSDLVRLPISRQIVATALEKAFEQYPPPASE